MRRYLRTSLLFLLGPAALAAPPTPVSPAGAVADPCPTFSWSLEEAARGYEVVIYPVNTRGVVADRPSLTASLPPRVQSWTPPGDRCLEPGGRYAWSIRMVGREDEGWSEAMLIEVSAAPTVREIEAALATLRRHLAVSRAIPDAAPPNPGGRTEPGPRAAALEPVGAPQAPRSRPAGAALAAKEAPTLGTPSLALSDQLHLEADSHVFQDGAPFLWDDTTGNLALGRNALMSASGTATGNTAVGREALQSTSDGATEFQSTGNTAVGDRALFSNTTGRHNAAVGYHALYSGSGSFNTAVGAEALRDNTSIFNTATGFQTLWSNTSGQGNAAFGLRALWVNTTGSSNTAVGYGALYTSTEGSNNVGLGSFSGSQAPPTANNNVFIANAGKAEDTTPTIRIGSAAHQTRAFIAGIHGATLAGGDEQDVCVDDEEQLGPCSISSARFKEQVEDLDGLGPRILELRPVSFRYRPGILGGPEHARVGLIAEEVAKLFPELVTRDRDGRPFAVRYELLSVLLLDELQRQHARLEALEAGGSRKRLAR